MKNQEKIKKIKTATFQKPYIFIFILIFLAYLFINIFINKVYETFHVLTSLAKWYLIPFVLFNFLILPFLVALTFNLSLLRFKESGFKFKKEKSTSLISLGAFGGLLGGACAGCFAGLFPAFIGIFGITATLGVLPFYGLEIQFISALFLVFAVHLLTKNITCKVPLGQKTKNGRK